MGYNRSGVKFVKRMKRRRREEMRLSKRGGAETAKPVNAPPKKAPTTS